MKEWILKTVKKPIFIVLLFLAVFFCLGVGGTYAYYQVETENTSPITAEAFSFTSDYLSAEGGSYPVYGSSVSFFLKNSDGLTVTKSDLEYSLTVSGGVLDSTNGTLTGGAVNYKTHTLTGSGTVTVTATSTAPYAKTLTATFEFIPLDSTYQIIDEGDYILLDIFTGTWIPDAGFTVEYGANLAPDNSEELTKNWVNATSGTIPKSSLAPNSHYQLIFFEINGVAKDYAQTLTSIADNGEIVFPVGA